MDTLAPWESCPGLRSLRLLRAGCAVRSLSGQKRRWGAGERLEAPPPGSGFQASSFAQTRGRKEGQGRSGASRLHLSSRQAVSAAKAWLVERAARDRAAWGRAPQHSWAGGIGLGAPQQTPRTRARSGQGKVGPRTNPILRNPQQSRLESPGPVHIRVRAQTRRGAAGAHASWKFPQQVLVAPLVEN